MQELAQSDAPFVLAAEKLLVIGGIVAIVSITPFWGLLMVDLMQAQMPMAAAEDGLFLAFLC